MMCPALTLDMGETVSVPSHSSSVAAALHKAKVGRDRARPSLGKMEKFRRWSSRQASLHFQAGDLREVRICCDDYGVYDEGATSNHNVGQGQDSSASI